MLSTWAWALYWIRDALKSLEMTWDRNKVIERARAAAHRIIERFNIIAIYSSWNSRLYSVERALVSLMMLCCVVDTFAQLFFLSSFSSSKYSNKKKIPALFCVYSTSMASHWVGCSGRLNSRPCSLAESVSCEAFNGIEHRVSILNQVEIKAEYRPDPASLNCNEWTTNFGALISLSHSGPESSTCLFKSEFKIYFSSFWKLFVLLRRKCAGTEKYVNFSFDYMEMDWD